MLKIHHLLLLCLLLAAKCAMAKINTESVEYSLDGKTMEGFLAYDDANNKPQPGILIVHDWMGLGQFVKDKAIKLATLGYVAFAADIYGKDVRPHDTTEASKWVAMYKNDRLRLRKDIFAAFSKFSTMKEVDPHKIVVMGYCFGGTTALELARSGAPLLGTVSFHGGLSTPHPQDAKNIKGRVLILHGSDDPNVPPSEVKAFYKEMKNAGVNMKFIGYEGAVHAFTNPEAGSDTSKGAAYNPKADQASWSEFEKFLKEVVKS